MILKKRRVPNITNFLGSFVHDFHYNLLLEFADRGNLEEYFRNVQIPSTVEDITSFWTELFHLIDSLMGIHNMQIGDVEDPQIFQGYVCP